MVQRLVVFSADERSVLCGNFDFTTVGAIEFFLFVCFTAVRLFKDLSYHLLSSNDTNRSDT